MSAPKKSRGLSLEEKRLRMHEFLLEKSDFFQLKELEKQLPKAKGIVSQSVKEVLQSLVDDRMVCSERIGVSNYFWCFKSSQAVQKKNTLDTLKADMEKYSLMSEELEEQIQKELEAKEPNSERDDLLNKYESLTLESARLASEIQSCQSLDPELYKEKCESVKALKLYVDKWTDNIFSIQSYCVDNFGLDRNEFMQQFGLSADFDYVS